jgi:DNA-binding response OmpR family regulator
MVIDDEEGLLELLTAALEAYGYKAIPAVSAVATLTHAGAAPDLIVTDLHLCGADGLELANAASSLWPACRICYMSGHYGPKAGSPGFHFLEKPFSLAAFLAKVNVLLRS